MYQVATVDETAPADSDMDNLEYIGCYDVWENKTEYLEDNVYHNGTLAFCSTVCETLYAGSKPQREYILGARGYSCFCPYVDVFNLVRVPDAHCSIDCVDMGDILERGEKTCGGSYSISAYCLRNTGQCDPFKSRPINKDLYAEHADNGDEKESLEEILPISQIALFNEADDENGNINFPYCAHCSSCGGILKPDYDYLANDSSPDVCIQFCRRKISYYTNRVELTIREPTKFAFAGWIRRSTETMITCGCTDELVDLTAVDNSMCEIECADGSPCGSKETVKVVSVYSTKIEEATGGNGNDKTTTNVPDTTTPLAPTETECGGQKQCHGVDPYEQIWIACAGDVPARNCPNGASGSAYWVCLSTGEFEGPSPVYTDCSTQWVQELQKTIETGTEASATEILTKVEDMCTQAKSLENTQAQYFGHEIDEILSMVEEVVKDVNLTQGMDLVGFEELAGTVAYIGDSVLTNPRTWTQLTGLNCSIAVSSLLRTLEESSFELAEEAQESGHTEYSKSFGSPMISLLSGVTKPDATSNQTLKFESGGSYIELPPGWQNVFPPTVSSPSQFIGMGIVTVESNPFPTNVSGLSEDDTKDFNGKIMSFSLTRPSDNTTISFPDAGVYIRIQHDVVAWGNAQQRKEIRRKLHDGEQAKAILGSGVCAYWDTKFGIWSQQGCKLIASDSEITQCECFHLTSFAVLFSYYEYVEKSVPLEVLTIVLCSLSVICLLATIIIFTIVRATHGTRTTITKNLAFCLLIGNVLVLLVVDRNYFNMSEGFCMGAGIVTHYVFLCAFMWMAVEGYHLYKMMVHVFDSGHSHLRLLRVIAYGFPLLIVIVTGVTGVALNQRPYGGEEFCWLNGLYTLAFTVPVGVVVCGNLVVLIITLRTAYRVQSSPSQIQDRKRSYRTWIRGCFSITILLGVTWIVGYIQMIGSSVVSEVAAYIFTILNASQGFFIFVYHCLLNEKVRMAAERRNIRYPAWLSDPTSNTNTTSGATASIKNNSRFGGQNIQSFYSGSGASGKREMKSGSDGPVERFGNRNSVQNDLDRSSNVNNFSNILRGSTVRSVSSSSSTSSSTLGTGTDTIQSQNDLLPEFRRHRYLSFEL